MTSAAVALDESRFGFIGHFRLKDELKEAARASGLEIRQQGTFSRSYRVTPVFNHARLDDIVPAHIRSQRQADGSRVMQRSEIKNLLAFMHQPLRGALTTATENDINEFGHDTIAEVTAQFGDIEKIPPIFLEAPMAAIRDYTKERRGQAAEELQLLRRFLSFSTSGSVRLDDEKKFHHQEAKVTDDDEHVGIQQQIDADVKLKNAVEMGGEFIPQARFDKEKGLFAISIYPGLRGNGFAGNSQNALAGRFLGIIKDIAPDQLGQPVIHLNSTQLVKLCDSVHKDAAPLAQLVTNVSHEEHVQFALTEIERRAGDLEKDQMFARLSAMQGPADTTKHLSNILKSTSALTGLLKSPVLEETWKRYHFTDRAKSPVEDLLKEAEAFRAVAQHYIERGNITGAELEAISHEFFPLMMMGAEAMQTFRHSLEKAPDSANDVALCQQLEDQFRGASLVQDAMARKYMPEDKRNMLEAFSIYSGEQKYSAAKKIGEVLHNYGKDVVNSVREHPKITLSVVLTIVALLRIAAWATPSQAPIDPNKAFEQLDILIPGGETITQYKNAAQLPQADIESWHWDIVFTDVKNMILTGSPMKKHYFGKAAANLAELGNLWRAPLKYAMELTGQPVQAGLEHVRPADHPFLFEQAFNSTLPKVDNAWLITNVPQDLSHSGYWGWSGLKGLFQGFAGTAALFKLFNPIIDMGYTAGAALSDKARFRSKNKEAQEAIRSILQQVERPEPVVTTAAAASEKQGRLSVSNAWIGEKTVSYQAPLEETQAHIARLNLAARHIGSEMGVEDVSRRQTIEKELAALEKIMSRGGDFETLQKQVGKHLTRAAALETVYTGRSNIYDTFLGDGEAMDDKTARKLKRLGTHVLRTGDYQQTRRNEAPFLYWRMGPARNALAAAKIGASYAGEGFSHLMNGVRLAKETKPSDLAFQPLIDSRSRLVRTFSRPAVAVASALSGTSVYLDHANKIQELPQALQPVVQAISEGSGVAAAAAFSTANFLGWNLTVSDLLQVHFITGLGLSTIMATVAHYPNRFAVKPLTGYFRELSRKPKAPENPPEFGNSPEMMI